jgi:cyclopropane fatty-acyl-phospholipid synthase-like methyltransferase
MAKDPVHITRNTYDKIAPEYVKRKERSKLWMLVNFVVVRKFIKALPHTSKGAILVVGPAGGHTAVTIAQKTGQHVHGVDISKGMVAEARKRIATTKTANCTFEVADITTYNLANNYDGIFCDGVLYHIPREKLPALLKKFHKRLNTEGVLYANFKVGVGFELQENPVTFGSHPRAYWFYHTKELEELFAAAGFSATVKPARISIFGEQFIEVLARHIR